MALRIQLGGIVLAGIVGVSAPAWAQSYRCQVTETGQVTNWIAADMMFAVDGNGGVQVNDGIIQYEKGGPIAAKVTKNDGTRLSFTWALDMTNPNVQSTRMTYRATFEPGTGKIRVHAKPNGYSNDFEGRGTCKKA